MPIPLSWLGLVALFLLIPFVAGADQVIVPSNSGGTGTFGDAARGWADPTGAAQASYTFNLPSARGKAQPLLRLTYTSTAAVGDVREAGVGWGFDIPSIESRALQGGDPTKGTREYFQGKPLVFVGQVASPTMTMLDGTVEQLPSWAMGSSYYRLQDDSSHLRFFGRTAQATDGRTLKFHSSFAGRHRLTEESDNHCESGSCNKVTYQYTPLPKDGEVPVLTDIFDTPSLSAPGDYGKYAHHTRIIYEPNDPGALDPAKLPYAPAWKRKPAMRIKRIDVASNGHNGAKPRAIVRRYHFTYETRLRHSYLTSIQEEGACTLAEESPAAPYEAPPTNCPRLPPTTFEYGDSTPFFGPSHMVGPGYDTPPTSGPLFPSLQNVGFADVNRDGSLDIVQQPAPGQGGNGKVFVTSTLLNGNTFIDEQPLHTPNPKVLATSGDLTILQPTDLTNLTTLHWAQWQQTPQPGYQVNRMRLIPFQISGDPRQRWSLSTSSPPTTLPNSIVTIGDVDSNGTPDAYEYSLVSVIDPATGEAREVPEAKVRLFDRFKSPQDPDEMPASNAIKTNNIALNYNPQVPFYTFADMNGDGVTDFVTIRAQVTQLRGVDPNTPSPNTFIYFPGDATGKFACNPAAEGCKTTIPQCYNGGGSVPTCPSPWIELTSAPLFTGVPERPTLIEDVDMDGLADIMQVEQHPPFTYLRIWRNDDGRSFHEVDPDVAPFTGFVRVALGDINGSGTTDAIFIEPGDAAGHRAVDMVEHYQQYPGLLTTIKNGVGGITEFTYQSVQQLDAQAKKDSKPWNSHSPVPMHVVTKVVQQQTGGGVSPGDTTETKYSYRDPAYDAWEARLLGFREVKVHEVPNLTILTKYYFGRCQPNAGACRETSDADFEKPLTGAPYQVDVYWGADRPHSTTTTHYKVARLYKEPTSERDISFAYPDRVDTFLYDATNYQPHAVSFDAELVADVRVPKVGITLSSEVGRQHLLVEQDQDNYGNVVATRDRGRVKDDYSPIDPVIETIYAGMGFVGNPDLYVFGPSSKTTKGFGNRPGLPADPGRTISFTYNTMGEVTDVKGTLSGTLPLKRFHESDARIAPDPPNASVDGQVLLTHIHYDSLGNVGQMYSAANTACTTQKYDKDYGHLPDTTTRYIKGCSGASLSDTTIHDVRFDRPHLLHHADGTRSQIDYDSFGRVATTIDPDPDNVGMLSTAASIFSYSVPSGGSVSGVSVKVPTGNGQWMTAWQYVDGFGKTIASIVQADPEAGDAAPWIVQGATKYLFGRPSHGWRPYPRSDDPAQLSFSYPTRARDVGATIDGIGRVHDADDRGRSIWNSFYALSVDIWDTEDRTPSSPHQSTPRTVQYDGHGRIVAVMDRVNTPNGLDMVSTSYDYNAVGQVVRMRKSHSLGSESVVRWMQYDSLGRLVLNAEPNTTKNFTANAHDTAAVAAMGAWRYAYDDAGRIVGTSDARGCGKNTFYDGLGRTLAEDYSPCLSHHEKYTPVRLSTGEGAEVLYQYDVPGYLDSPTYKGKLTAVADRGAITHFSYDGRGRVKEIARKVTRPASSGGSFDRDFGGLDELGISLEVDEASATDDDDRALAPSRYTSHVYRKTFSYDLADRPIREGTGADVDELLENGQSNILYAYSARGFLRSVGSSYGPIVASMTYNVDGTPSAVTYADAAKTVAQTTYGDHDVKSYTISRPPPSLWSADVPPKYLGKEASAPLTFQPVLANLSFTYDGVGNPLSIVDGRNPDEWPAGARPKSQTMAYDDLYRLTSETVKYGAPNDVDVQISPFAYEEDDSRSTIAPRLSRDKRVTGLNVSYDFSGNTTSINDNDSTVFDRSSLGTITNGKLGAHPDRLTSSSLGVQVAYDDAGNVVEMFVPRTGECHAEHDKCSHHFVYDWDELGQLARARRWDYHEMPADEPRYPDIPGQRPDVATRYAYSQGQRVVRSVEGRLSAERHSVEVFGTLRLDSAPFTDDYSVNAATESVYLGGFAHVMMTDDGLPENPMSGFKRHVFLTVGDKLGSTNVVIERDTGELAENIQYHPYGTVDSDYRPERWGAHREPYQFTGKESDTAVGLTYFGARYYSPALARWMSADPLTVHAAMGDMNPYAYVGGSPLDRTDPVGLCDENYWWCGFNPLPGIIGGGGGGGGGGGNGGSDGGNGGGSGYRAGRTYVPRQPTSGPAGGTWLGIEPSWFGGSTRTGYAAQVADEFNSGVNKHSTVIAATGVLAVAQSTVVAATATTGFFSTVAQTAARGWAWAGNSWTSIAQWGASKAPWTVGAGGTITKVAASLNNNPLESVLGGLCFTAGTLVTTCNDGQQPIEVTVRRTA
ncbi:RHS repeat-associated core domain-containing protein [Pendulispora albinea]|uniref:Insecticide toxin TcdB middle/N-terminal domain-containing protein n=1 Tax=Pendulispora albinea TaxID=2741071 RepID=A0ABZ2M9I6_9BACT